MDTIGTFDDILFENDEGAADIINASENREKGCYRDMRFFFGEEVWNNSPKRLVLTDCCALQDPLLSHLPAVYEEGWRTGHMHRLAPEGYAESVKTGINCIVDPQIHEYYDKILLVTTGDIFTRERISTIIKLNMGRYDYLIQ